MFKEHANAIFGHPYKVEKETPFYFQDGICDRAPRLTYEGGQEVISHNFIFPPCLHFLHLGAKMQRIYGYTQYIYALECYLFTCFHALDLVNLLQKHELYWWALLN